MSERNLHTLEISKLQWIEPHARTHTHAHIYSQMNGELIQNAWIDEKTKREKRTNKKNWIQKIKLSLVSYWNGGQKTARQ